MVDILIGSQLERERCMTKIGLYSIEIIIHPIGKKSLTFFTESEKRLYKLVIKINIRINW